MADHDDDIPDTTPEADDLQGLHIEEALGDAANQPDNFALAGDDPPLEPDPVA